MAKKIVVDPAKLEAASQKVDAQNAEYQRQYLKMFSEVDGMGAAWQGADNVAYVNQIRGFLEDFHAMNNLMKQYSEFLKQAANVYKQAQTETINAAKKLSN